MAELFMIGGALFWFFIAVVIIGFFIAIEYDSFVWSTIMFAATIGVVSWLSNLHLWANIAEHPYWTAIIIAGYLVFGLVWSMYKWRLYNIKMKEKFKEALEEKNNAISFAKPKFKDNEWRILLWWIYWPLSFVWTVINDLIKRFFKYIVRKLKKVYEAISDSVYADIPVLNPAELEGLVLGRAERMVENKGMGYYCIEEGQEENAKELFPKNGNLVILVLEPIEGKDNDSIVVNDPRKERKVKKAWIW